MIDFLVIYSFCSILLKFCEETYLLYSTNMLFEKPSVQRKNVEIIDLAIKVFSSSLLIFSSCTRLSSGICSTHFYFVYTKVAWSRLKSPKVAIGYVMLKKVITPVETAEGYITYNRHVRVLLQPYGEGSTQATRKREKREDPGNELYPAP